MSTGARAATDPRRTSPKVKSAGVWGAVITGALIVAAAFLQSIPRDALEQLGPWAAPVGAAVATAAAVIAAYAKGDPAREPSLLLGESGGVFTSANDVGAERFVQGEYASNAVLPQQRPAVELGTAHVEVRPIDESGAEHLADETDETRAAESEAAAAALAEALREQLPDEG